MVVHLYHEGCMYLVGVGGGIQDSYKWIPVLAR